MIWENLGYKELLDIDKETPVVLGVASIEQHGPHLPVSTDSAIGEHFLNAISDTLGDRVLILPIVKVCCSEHHMDFAGSLTTTHEIFISYAMSILESAASHGFKNFVIINFHGGNIAASKIISEKFGVKYHKSCNIMVSTVYHVAIPELLEIIEGGKFSTGHACEIETSLMMHISPEVVKVDKIPSSTSYVGLGGSFDGDMLHRANGDATRTIRQMSGGTGVLGSPHLASAEKGKTISEVITKKLSDLIEEFRSLKMN